MDGVVVILRQDFLLSSIEIVFDLIGLSDVSCQSQRPQSYRTPENSAPPAVGTYFFTVLRLAGALRWCCVWQAPGQLPAHRCTALHRAGSGCRRSASALRRGAVSSGSSGCGAIANSTVSIFSRGWLGHRGRPRGGGSFSGVVVAGGLGFPSPCTGAGPGQAQRRRPGAAWHKGWSAAGCKAVGSLLLRRRVIFRHLADEVDVLAVHLHQRTLEAVGFNLSVTISCPASSTSSRARCSLGRRPSYWQHG